MCKEKNMKINTSVITQISNVCQLVIQVLYEVSMFFFFKSLASYVSEHLLTADKMVES